MLMIDGAVILLAGILIGRFLPSRRRRPKPPRDPKPICGCGHHYSFHSDGNGCHAYAGNYSTEKGGFICRCDKYVGPEPLPTYVAEIGGA